MSEVEKKDFNQKEYNQKYYKDNKHKKSICVICGGKTSPFNKYQHEHSKKHIKKVEELKNPSINDFCKMLISNAKDLNMKFEIKDNSLIIG
jgi:epoxyqueuosine reductase QueG